MKWAAYFWILGGILSLLLNIFLIPMAGMLGAAISQCISYLSIAVAVGLMSWRLYPLDVRWLRLGTVVLGGTLAGAVMSIPWHANPFASLAIKSPFVFIGSCTVAWLFAADWCNRLLRSQALAFRAE